MSSPKVAVVIPGYNHASYIGPAIASVLAQDWPNLELHVLDDGSSDQTAAVAEQAVAGQTRVPCRVERQENQGSARTLNRLIERVDADHVAVLNSDDLYAPGRLSAMLGQVRDRELSFAFSGMDFAESGETTDFGLFENWYRSRIDYAAQLPTCGFALLTANIAVTSSNFLFTRELFDLVGGFDPALPLTQDWDFAVKTLRWTEPTLVPARLLSYRVHPGNTWRRLQEVRLTQSEQVLRNFALWAGEATPNGRAPTPGNWPAFFPFFARVCSTLFSDAPLGASLPAELLLPPPGRGPQDPLESAATLRLLAAARQSPADTGSTEAALAFAAAHWSRIARNRS